MLIICFLGVDLWLLCLHVFFVQAEDGIRDLVRSRGLGDVYKRQVPDTVRAVVGKLPLNAPVTLTTKLDVAGPDTAGPLSLIHI